MLEMGIGMKPELLLQLWLVFEGFSLWKIMRMPDQVGVVPTDYTDACNTILNGDDSPVEKINKANSFRDALRDYRFWRRIVDYLDKAYIGIFLSIMIVSISLFIDLENPVIQCLLTWLLVVYMILKMGIYRWAKLSFVRYNKELDKIVSVEVPKTFSDKIRNMKSL